jgi:hypothetical protein
MFCVVFLVKTWVTLPELFKLATLLFGIQNLLLEPFVPFLQTVNLLYVVGTSAVLQNASKNWEADFNFLGHNLQHVLHVVLQVFETWKHILDYFDSIARLNLETRFQSVNLKLLFFHLSLFKFQLCGGQIKLVESSLVLLRCDSWFGKLNNFKFKSFILNSHRRSFTI